MADTDLRFTRPAPAAGDVALRFGGSGPGVALPVDASHVDLRFDRAAHGEGALDLRFGDGREQATAPPVDVGLHGSITGLRGRIAVGALVQARVYGCITGLRGAVGLRWDSDVDRPRVSQRADRWQCADAVGDALDAGWRRAAPCASDGATAWQDAELRGAPHVASWRRPLPASTAAATGWQRAAALGAGQAGSYQQADRHAAGGDAWFQAALDRAAASWSSYQDAHHRTQALVDRLQRALVSGVNAAAMFNALARSRGVPAHSRFQEARRPQAGSHPAPVVPVHRCYDPAGSLDLRFARPVDAALQLWFVCGGDTRPDVPVPPRAVVVVARRRSYIMLTSISVHRADTGRRLPVLAGGFSMQLDHRSWAWSFAFNMHAAGAPLVARGDDGQPVELLLQVNGQPFSMLAETRSRTVQFPTAVMRVSGRSKTALLDGDVRSFSQPAARTAQQIALDALTINGVSNGWALDWQVADWPVPAGTWAHQGSWISAVNDVASSVGAYVQPHDTDQVLRVLPRYPVRSWQLQSAVPDIELPAGIASVEEVDWITKSAFDALYLHGTPGTALYYRKRAGTAGTHIAPMAVHALLVHPDAAAQRAIAELSDTGRQVAQKLRLPVLPQTGVIKPGVLVRYTDDEAVARTGIVRGVSINDGPARVEQTIEVQAHE